VTIAGSNATQINVTWVINTSLLIDVTVTQPILCTTDLGINNKCNFSDPPNPSYDAAKKTCDNVVLEVMNLNCGQDTTIDMVLWFNQMLL